MRYLSLLEVRGAPSYYACQEGILDNLEALLQSNQIKNCLVIHGKKSWVASDSYFPQMNTVHLTFVPYHGECSLAETERLANMINKCKYKFDAVIGIGGGKVLDLTKAVGDATQLDVILIPTLASTCAAWTPLSVFYNEDGEFTHYTMFPKSSLIVLVEPRIILNAPIKYFRAGIADTLAKWYEADVLSSVLTDIPIPLNIALQTAKLCQSVLLQHGPQSLEDIQANQLSSEFLQVLETIIVAGGMVGGFGNQYGRIAGAHSIHNGLTVAKETHHLLHGEKVAYGILVQLALEEKWNEIKALIPFYKKLQLPVALTDLGLAKEEQETLKSICQRTINPGESIHLMDGDMTVDRVLKGFLELEELVVASDKELSI